MNRIVCCSLAVLCAAVFSLLFSGCGEGKKPAMPVASSPQVAQAAEPALPQESPEEEAKQSGGLGLRQAAFEINHGTITLCNSGTKNKTIHCAPDTETQKIIIRNFQPTDNIRVISVIFLNRPSLSEMRRFNTSMLPNDSKLIETYSLEGPNGPVDSPSDAPIDLYRSQWLAARFSEEVWRTLGVEPGVFSVKNVNETSEINLGRERR